MSDMTNICALPSWGEETDRAVMYAHVDLQGFPWSHFASDCLDSYNEIAFENSLLSRDVCSRIGMCGYLSKDGRINDRFYALGVRFDPWTWTISWRSGLSSCMRLRRRSGAHNTFKDFLSFHPGPLMPWIVSGYPSSSMIFFTIVGLVTIIT